MNNRLNMSSAEFLLISVFIMVMSLLVLCNKKPTSTGKAHSANKSPSLPKAHSNINEAQKTKSADDAVGSRGSAPPDKYRHFDTDSPAEGSTGVDAGVERSEKVGSDKWWSAKKKKRSLLVDNTQKEVSGAKRWIGRDCVLHGHGAGSVFREICPCETAPIIYCVDKAHAVTCEPEKTQEEENQWK